ncbi:uncharacterized protein LOC124777728 isoform X2 [Schistocerca piceifrons]|uniref:uncharacterized protein LOC124777728 isoform X2 n=1 Tax=Schistocerca piceifrons TaxID=274613 RepID=UPI001F5F84D2|nr:uncharacterized protein LOC124777728 isoform X2 [Schistocerca piceifrons]
MTMTGMLAAALVVVTVLQYARAAGVFCDYFIPVCEDMDPDVCRARGGVYIRKGSFCGFCDICPKYVGEGESCKNDKPYLLPTLTAIDL